MGLQSHSPTVRCVLSSFLKACSWQGADLEDGRFNYSVPRKAANRSPLGEQSFSRGGSQGARGRRNTPRKRPLGSDDEDDANQARGQHESASEQDAIMSLVTLKQQPPREVQAGRGTASQRSGAKERRRGDDGVSEPGLPPRANLKRQALSGFSPGRGSWGEERGRRTGASVEPGAVRTTAPRSAGKREARPEFSRRAVEHNRAPAGDGNLQPGVQSQRSLGLGTGAGPGQASAFTNLQTSSQATPPKEHRPISPALAAHDRDDLVGSLSLTNLSCGSVCMALQAFAHLLLPPPSWQRPSLLVTLSCRLSQIPCRVLFGECVGLCWAFVSCATLSCSCLLSIVCGSPFLATPFLKGTSQNL